MGGIDMELKTKYTTLQQVWYMRNNKVDNAQVIRAVIQVTWNDFKKQDEVEESYLLNDGDGSYYDGSKLFPSKEELIKSL